jgi:ParB family chromosome partitioning protein
MAMVKMKPVEVPLDNLLLAKGKAPAEDIHAGIADLAESIRAVGLLQPVVVCKSDKLNKFELLQGKRRVLAVRSLHQKTVSAILVRRDAWRPGFNLMESELRRPLSEKDLSTACKALYEKYGTIRAVAEMTALPYQTVRKLLRSALLNAKVKKSVDPSGVQPRRRPAGSRGKTPG